MISVLIFTVVALTGILLFTVNVRKIRRNILIGKFVDLTSQRKERMATMLRVAFGQKKMMTRPIPAILHLFVYVGFILINFEVLEMFTDGLLHTHRAFSFLGSLYNWMIAFFEVLAFLVTFGCALFLIRRNVIRIARFRSPELKGWPRSDANIILCSEIILMSALFIMNAADQVLQKSVPEYIVTGVFPISSFLVPLLTNLSTGSLIVIERSCWWVHLIGIFAFMNYLPYSKHFHIILAFPTTWFSNLNPLGKFNNLDAVTDVVKPNFDPGHLVAENSGEVKRFGAKDVSDLTWKQLLDAYTCTECGRCSSVCPQNITGKKLSPRKIMMDTRDRLQEVGRIMDSNGGIFKEDGKSLVGDYIQSEEIWACNTCNACTEECPVNIDPLSIILDLRRYLVMEESKAPAELNNTFSNIENNGAPWQFPASERANWSREN